MNGQSQQEPSIESLPWYRNGPDEGRSRQGGRPRAEVLLQAFSFGPFRVIPYARLLERDGLPVVLGSRAFDLLCILISRPGDVIYKNELMARAWPNVTVDGSNLRYQINLLRRALGDRQRGVRYVVNVPGQGYCFVACVSREAWSLNEGRGDSTPCHVPQRNSAPLACLVRLVANDASRRMMSASYNSP